MKKVHFDHLHNQTTFITRIRMRIKSSSIPHSEIKSTSTTPTTKSISSVDWNKFNFDPAHWNQLNFNYQNINEVNFDPHPKPSDFRPTYKNESISITRKETKTIDPQNKIKSFSAHTQILSQFQFPRLKPSMFRLIHRNHVKCDLYTESKSVSTSHTKK